DPNNSVVFQTLLNNPKLKNSTRNFAAICEADIGAVPTLEDFLNGRNIPAAKARTDIRIPTGPVAYISAFPVIDALNFEAAARHVGDKVELIGQIVEVKEDVGRRGRGQGKPYVFINFGPWRGNIVKISIWSEGLAKLKDKPSKSWVGRWISVTGLMDPPYSSKRYHYTHFAVTVQEDGQIKVLDEKQARFRLGKAAGVAAPPQKPTASFKPPTHNQNILIKFGKTKPAPQPQPPPQPRYSGHSSP